MRLRQFVWLGCVVLLGVTVFSGVVAADVETIEACEVISESGEYELTQDIDNTGTCIEITASDVTLNGNGFNVTGPGNIGGISGVFANGPEGTDGEIENITVSNVTLEGWSSGNPSYGIRYENVVEGKIHNINGLDNSDNIAVLDSLNVTISNSRFSGGMIDITDSANVRIVDNDFNETTIAVLALNAPGLEIVNNEIIDDVGGPIDLTHVKDSVIADNNISNNSGDSLFGFNVTDTTIQNNNIQGSGQYAISFDQSDNNTIQNNTLADNRLDGVTLSFANDNEIIDNHIENNTRDGVRLIASSENTVRDNTIRENVNATTLTNSDETSSLDNLFINNTVRSNERSLVVEGGSSTIVPSVTFEGIH